MNLDLWPFFKPSFCRKTMWFFWSKHLSQESVSGSGEDKTKERSSLLVKPTTEKTNCFLNYFGSLRDAPTTFLDAGTRELILLMSPVAERILYPPELKVTSGTTHRSTAVRLAPELHFPSWGLDSCNNPIKAPSDNKWAAAELNSRLYMWDKYGLERHNLEVCFKKKMCRWGGDGEKSISGGSVSGE